MSLKYVGSLTFGSLSVCRATVEQACGGQAAQRQPEWGQ